VLWKPLWIKPLVNFRFLAVQPGVYSRVQA
jgi:hypothetical protein